jgi:hypothetical protein
MVREDFIGSQRLISPDGERYRVFDAKSPQWRSERRRQSTSTASCDVHLGSPIHAFAWRASRLERRQPTFEILLHISIDNGYLVQLETSPVVY